MQATPTPAYEPWPSTAAFLAGSADQSPPASAGASSSSSYFSCPPDSSLHQPPQTLVIPFNRNYSDWEPSGDPQTDLSQEFRHSGWLPDRKRVYRALLAANKGENRLKAFCQCGMHAQVMKAKIGPEDYKIASCKCHDRFCVPCAREKAYRVKAKVMTAIGDQQIRMLTLGLYAVPGDALKPLLTKLVESFRQLRRLKLWTDSIEGEIHFVEVTRGEKGNHWHVHLHALTVGSYIEVGWVSQAWKAITHGSCHAHITLARSINGVAAYVGKYASKGFDASTLKEPELLVEAIKALVGVRMMDATGTLRKSMNDAEEADYLKPGEWEVVMNLSDMWKSAAAGNMLHRRILADLHVRDPATNSIPAWCEMEESG